MGSTNTSPDVVEDFFEHYGVKGMRWGVIKDRSKRKTRTIKEQEVKKAIRSGSDVVVVKKGQQGSVVKGKKLDSQGNPRSDVVVNKKTGGVRARSSDAVSRDRTSAIINEFGLDAVSNRQLQDYNNRLNLEQNYAKLAPKPKTTAKDFVKKALADAGNNELNSLVKQGKKGPILGAIEASLGAKAKKKK